MRAFSSISGFARWKRLAAPALAGHSALGLAIAALAYIVSLSGTIAVFAPMLQRWEQPSAPVVTSASDAAIEVAIAAIARHDPKAMRGAITVTLPQPHSPRLMVGTGGEDEANAPSWWADARGVPVMAVRHPFTDFIVGLHAYLLLPRIVGLSIVGLVGLAMLALTISGVLALPRFFKDAYRLRRRAVGRVGLADLHNRIGTWGLPFHLVITFTGALLGTFFLIFAGIAGVSYKGDMSRAVTDIIGPIASTHGRPAPLPPVARLIALHRAAAIGAISLVDVQQGGTDAARIGITEVDPVSPLVPRRTTYDRAGHVVHRLAAPSFPQQVMLAAQPLHFGRFAGLVVELAYGILGLALCVMIASGMHVWFTRRRTAGRPTAGLERLWIAVEWGQPCALLCAAAAALLWAASPLVVWGLVTVGSAVVATVPIRLGSIVFRGRMAAALLLCTAAMVHALLWASAATDATGLIVDGALASAGLMLAGQTVRTRRRERSVGSLFV